MRCDLSVNETTLTWDSVNKPSSDFGEQAAVCSNATVAFHWAINIKKPSITRLYSDPRPSLVFLHTNRAWVEPGQRIPLNYKAGLCEFPCQHAIDVLSSFDKNRGGIGKIVAAGNN